LAEEEDGDQ